MTEIRLTREKFNELNERLAQLEQKLEEYRLEEAQALEALRTDLVRIIAEHRAELIRLHNGLVSEHQDAQRRRLRAREQFDSE